MRTLPSNLLRKRVAPLPQSPVYTPIKTRCKRRHCVMPFAFVIYHSRKQGFPAPAPSICTYLCLRGRVSRRVLYCCHTAAARETERRANGERWVSLPLTRLSYRSPRKKDFKERFFAKRSGERFKRGVRLRRTTRRVRSAVTTSVRKKKCESNYSYTTAGTDFRNRARGARTARRAPARDPARTRRSTRAEGRRPHRFAKTRLSPP